jgi:glycerol-3-phosphate cytidylyltransferase
VVVYNSEADVLEILKSVDWDVRILGDEYREKPFTGREETLDRCYFNRRPHQFSSSELRLRVVEGTRQAE